MAAPRSGAFVSVHPRTVCPVAACRSTAGQLDIFDACMMSVSSSRSHFHVNTWMVCRIRSVSGHCFEIERLTPGQRSAAEKDGVVNRLYSGFQKSCSAEAVPVLINPVSLWGWGVAACCTQYIRCFPSLSVSLPARCTVTVSGAAGHNRGRGSSRGGSSQGHKAGPLTVLLTSFHHVLLQGGFLVCLFNAARPNPVRGFWCTGAPSKGDEAQPCVCIAGSCKW